MLVSYRWLARHLDLEGLSPEDVAEALTTHTAEVEGVEPFAPWLGSIVVGHVLERSKHPDADKLSLCKVDVGAGDPLQIVCGAPNVDAGQRVAVARVGTVLPGELKIKKSKIRGVESRGMICSVRELGLGDEHSGIWVLPDEGGAIGDPVDQALGMKDAVIEIDNKSLTHRPDLWGHRGIAGEVAAILERELVPLQLELPAPLGEGGAAAAPYPVRVESQGCSRYLGLCLDGVRNGPSPEWMRQLLLAVGQRPLDLLVDLSNFVMLDLGQPNHLFDRRRLHPDGISVRDARKGEKLTTLDDVERELLETDILITSGDEPVALAGIMGGEATKVAEDTSELLLEAACFHPTRVRRTAARLGLRTDASARFEKSLDPTLPAKAAGHLVALLLEMQPDVRCTRPLGDAGSWKDPAKTIDFRPARARAVLGAELPDAEMKSILTRLDFGVKKGKTAWKVHVPSRRATKDVEIEHDLIEEVGRMHGYGEIAERSLVGALEPPPFDARRHLVRTLQDRLAGSARFHEAMGYSMQTDDLLERLGLIEEAHVQVVNPLIEGLARIRRSVLPSLIGFLPHGRRQREEVRLFEIGKGYRPDRSNDRGEPEELHQLALVWAEGPGVSRPGLDVGVLFRLRSLVEELFATAQLEAPVWSAGNPGEAPPWAHPVRWIRAGGPGENGDSGAEGLARVAVLEPGLARALGLVDELASEVAVAEVSLDGMLAQAPAPRTYAPIPRYPGIKVDVALSVPEQLPARELEGAIEKAGKGLVREVELFDLYRGEKLGAGKKSLAYHVLLQAQDRTLVDKDEGKFLGRIERAVADLGGELRKS